MKAVRLLEYGGQLAFTDVPTPTIARDEILVKIRSTAVNHLDLVEASGTARQILPIDLPWIPGHEFSGVVEQIGNDVAAWVPGDAVFGATTGAGGYAEYLAVKASAIARKPSNLSFEEAASVPVAAQTAWEGIFTHGHLKKGQMILIHGGAGAVGAYAVQLASHAGATIIATASGGDEAYLKSLGAAGLSITERRSSRRFCAGRSMCLRLGPWRYTEVVPRLEGRRPSRLRYPARIAGRGREAPRVGRDDEARAVRGDAQQNRAHAGRGDHTTRRRNRIRAAGCGPGLEGHRQEPARGTWEFSRWAGNGKTQVTRQDRASCGLVPRKDV